MDNHLVMNNVKKLYPHAVSTTQPFDVSFFGPFKAAYGRKCDLFMKSQLSGTITNYDVASIVKKAFSNITSTSKNEAGFWSNWHISHKSQCFFRWRLYGPSIRAHCCSRLYFWTGSPVNYVSLPTAIVELDNDIPIQVYPHFPPNSWISEINIRKRDKISKFPSDA